ncbi:MAG: efflux RND transporter periplasmic adaptor subunit [Desulfovibrionaceae bacterium]|nr:efflux RND transporter periplasmic adaptor subunit [Desulfovibrionaceae bacterium]
MRNAERTSVSGPRPLALALALLVLSLALAGCSNSDKGQKRRATLVSAGLIERRTVPLLIRAVGNVEALATVSVKSQVGGQIVREYVRNGQDLKKGDPLFLIDPRGFETEVREARAKLERDLALLSKAEKDILRYTDLKTQGVISQESYDQSLANVKALRATISLDRAQIEQAELQLDYADIRSPITGRAGNVLVNEGNVIKANDDRTLLVINQIEPISVAFSVPEAHLPEIQRRLAAGPLGVQAFVAGDDAHPEHGLLSVIDNTVDRTTGSIRLKAEFPNQAKRLWPGQFVRAALKLADQEGALVAPSQAVQTGALGPYVFVVKKDMTVEMRQVVVAEVMDQETVLASGVEAGETVVTDGHVQLVPGALVELKARPRIAAAAGNATTADAAGLPPAGGGTP